MRRRRTEQKRRAPMVLSRLRRLISVPDHVTTHMGLTASFRPHSYRPRPLGALACHKKTHTRDSSPFSQHVADSAFKCSIDAAGTGTGFRRCRQELVREGEGDSRYISIYALYM